MPKAGCRPLATDPPTPQIPYFLFSLGCFLDFTTIFWYLGSRRTDPSRIVPVNSILAPVPSGNRFSGNREIGVLETCGPEPLRTMAPKDGSIRLDPNNFLYVNFPPGIPGSQEPGIPGSRDPGILHPALGTSMYPCKMHEIQFWAPPRPSTQCNSRAPCSP